MSGDPQWNPEDTQTLDLNRLAKKTDREKWAEVSHQIQAMAAALGKVREQNAALRASMTWIKWILGGIGGIAVTALKLHG